MKIDDSFAGGGGANSAHHQSGPRRHDRVPFAMGFRVLQPHAPLINELCIQTLSLGAPVGSVNTSAAFFIVEGTDQPVSETPNLTI